MSNNKQHCYTSQLKYVFWLEENVSRVIGQTLMTPLGNNNLHFWNRGKFVCQPRQASNFLRCHGS